MKKHLLIAGITIILFSGFITKDNDFYFEINKSIDLYGRIYKEVALNYVDKLNPEEFMLAGISGMLTSLDPYTDYIDSSQQKDIDIITKGKYGGIGVTIGLRNGDITVVDLIEGYSAQRQGIRIGDVIKKIGDKEITKDNYDDLGEVLKGDPGTAIKVLIRRENSDEPLEFNLLREEIEIKNLSYYGFVPENSSNAYLKLSGFARTSGDEVKKALLELSGKKEIKTLVLDLRGNPGGLLDAAIDVCQKFLKRDQLIVSVRGRDSLSARNYNSSEEPIVPKVPMTVLIDGGTASAAEIVSGALQDHDRGIVVGTSSFGKGLVQTIISLPYNTSLKLTTARYYTPSGRSIQKINYSDKNKVFENYSTLVKKEFQTDNKRKVFSAGGINPDTLVENSSNSGLIQKLLSEGKFFGFATYFFNLNPKMNIATFSNESLLKEFSSYLRAQKFDFVSKSEKLIDQLKQSLEEENIDGDFIKQLEKAKNQIDSNHSNELNKYKDEIIKYIREELAARISGHEGRIKEALQNDKQFETAYSILQNKKLYEKMLHSSVN